MSKNSWAQMFLLAEFVEFYDTLSSLWLLLVQGGCFITGWLFFEEGDYFLFMVVVFYRVAIFFTGWLYYRVGN